MSGEQDRGELVLVSRGNPLDPTAHSGIPSGIYREAMAIGFAVRPLQARLPERVQALVTNPIALAQLRPARGESLRSALHRARAATADSAEMALLRSLWISRRIRSGTREPCAVIQHGTEDRLWTHAPLVTYEDSTLAQALRSYAYPELVRLTPRARAAWQRRALAAYRRARRCCTTTHWVAESIVSDYGIERSRVHVVGIGRNHELAPPRHRDWSSPRFLFVGADWARKGGPLLLAAFDRLHAEHPAARLDVVGDHPPIDQPGVVGHGPLGLDQPNDRAELKLLFEAATCFVLPSLHEPSAIAHTEALAAGLPSIGTSSGGNATIIADSGILIAPGDAEALVAAMRELCQQGRAASLGGRALERAPLFTWRAVTERLLRAAGVSVPDGAHAQFL